MDDNLRVLLRWRSSCYSARTPSWRIDITGVVHDPIEGLLLRPPDRIGPIAKLAQIVVTIASPKIFWSADRKPRIDCILSRPFLVGGRQPLPGVVDPDSTRRGIVTACNGVVLFEVGVRGRVRGLAGAWRMDDERAKISRRGHECIDRGS